MRRFPSVVPVLSLALAAGALTLAACSDSTTGPRKLSPSGADLSVTPGTNMVTIASDGSTLYCATEQANGVYTYPAEGYNPTGCDGGTLDLTTALNAYNPGWSAPITGSDWIGITTNGGPSSDYRTNPGRYVFQETFTIPTGATNISLNLGAMADNAVAVYLNGHLLGGQTITDCNAGTCNWQPANQLNVTGSGATFNTGATLNRLTVVLVNTPIGYPLTSGPLGGSPPDYGCQRDPQTFGWRGTTNLSAPADTVPTSPNHIKTGRVKSISNVGTVSQSGCENPSGVDFHGTVTWTPNLGIWCSPGFWKNHPELWTAQQGLLYNTHGPYPNDPQTFVGYDFGKKVGSSNPTLFDVISNPSIYGGPATNNVASYLSYFFFGTPLSANPTENCPDVLPFPAN